MGTKGSKNSHGKRQVVSYSLCGRPSAIPSPQQSLNKLTALTLEKKSVFILDCNAKGRQRNSGGNSTYSCV